MPPSGFVQRTPFGEVRVHRREHRAHAAAVDLQHALEMRVEQAAFAEAMDRDLRETARREIRVRANTAERIAERARHREPPEPQPRKQHLRERAEIEHVFVPVESLERRDRLAGVAEIRVEMVFEKRHAVADGDLDDLASPVERHRDAGRVLEVRHAVDEFRASTRQFVVEHVGPEPPFVHRDRDEFGS